jgi:hypothetical protein
MIFPRPFQEASHGSIVKRFLVEHAPELPELLPCKKPTSLVTSRLSQSWSQNDLRSAVSYQVTPTIQYVHI